MFYRRMLLPMVLLTGAGLWMQVSAATAIAPAASKVAPAIASTTSTTTVPLATLQKRAATGDAEAEVRLGQRLIQTKNTQDKQEAVALFRKAVAQGNADGEWELGAAYFTGAGVTRDVPTGLKWMHKSLSNGSAIHMLEYGFMEASFGGNVSDGMQWVRRSAEAGSTKGMIFWAMFEQHGNKKQGVAANPAAAKRWLLKAAHLGDSLGEQLVGQVYIRGDSKLGFARNTNTGLGWLNKAAAQGNSQAEGLLAVYLVSGKEDVPKDPATGVRWARKAAAEHDVYGYYALGLAYQQGLGGEPVDPAKAWYNFAAAQRMDVKHALSKVNIHLSEVGAKLSAKQLDELQAEVSKIPLPKKNQQT